MKIPSESPNFQRDWSYAYSKPKLHARFKTNNEDFVVRENLPFEPCGEGQHAYLRIRKIGLNSEDVARRLQRFCGVKAKAIGYAGLKDKRAVAEQWFSVDMAGVAQPPDWRQLQSDQLHILDVSRHQKRLRIGWVKSNRFDIVLRELSADRLEWESRLTLIRDNAVPNYFGDQRFGIDYANVAQSINLLLNSTSDAKRQPSVLVKRGFHYSVIRSFMFNEQLSARISGSTWQRALPGEFLILDGSQSFFQCEEKVDDVIEDRLRRFDIHPSAALPGKEKSPTQDSKPRYRVDVAQRWEQDVLEPYRNWIEALAQQGIEAKRRALRVKPQLFEWHWRDDNSLAIGLELPAGVYATTVLRELMVIDKAALQFIEAGEE